MLARPRIRQLTLGELLDESFRIYRRDLLTLIALAALVIVPYTILNTLALIPLQQEVAPFQDPAALPPAATEEEMGEQLNSILYTGLLSTAATVGLTILYTVVFQPLMEGALTRAVTRRYLDQPVTVGDSIGAALRRAFPLIAARLIPALAFMAIALVIFGGLFLLLGGVALLGISQAGAQEELGPGTGSGIAGIGILGLLCLLPLFGLLVLAFYVRVMFTSQAIIAENQGPLQALSRSWNLTKDYFWRTLGFVIVIGIITALISGVPTAIIGALAAAFVRDIVTLQLINGAAGAVANVLVVPFSLIAYTLMYYDLRIRKEGFDLEQQARNLMPDYGSTSYGQPLNQ